MPRGRSYRHLRPCYVIFLCHFDPMGIGNPIYEIQRSDLKNNLRLADDSITILLNTTCPLSKTPPQLQTLYAYLNNGTAVPEDEFLVGIHQEVMTLNQQEKGIIQIMTLEDERNMAYADAAFMMGRRKVYKKVKQKSEL